MADWIARITPESEATELRPDPDYPLLLQAGRHMGANANTLMRDPAWNAGRRACTLAVNARDAASLEIADGQQVRVVTAAGEVVIEAEITQATRPGQVIMPHGFGMIHQGRVYGANVNRLTQNTHRDPFAATPYHRYVPCRVEAV
jgi:anaerobic selenocysteine-containing dehydrogenase